jgi:uncharacterized protein YjcR
VRVSNPEINKEAIKTLVVAYGQREAARKAGLNVNTVMAWSRRYGWKQAIPETSHAICTQSPANALASVLQADNEATKLAWSTAGKKAAEHFAKLKPTVNKDRAAAAKNWHSVAAGTHGWNESQGQAQFSLNVLNLGGSVQIGVRNTDHESPNDTLGTDRA